MKKGPLRSRNINSFGVDPVRWAQPGGVQSLVAMLRFTLGKLAVTLVMVLVTAWLAFALLSPAGNFFGWLGHMLIGDFGMSASAGGPAGSLIAARLGVTVPLAILAMVLAALIAVGLGVLASRRADGQGDRAVVVFSAIVTAAPTFWLGMVLVLAFAGGLHWLPPGGFVPWQQNFGGAFVSLLLPAMALGLPAGCALAIPVRDALVAARTSDYVLAERARGVPEKDAFRRDGVPAAALAVLKPAIPQAAAIVLGTVIVENVFYLPGLGRLILDAVTARDLTLVSGALVVLVLLVGMTAFLLQVGSVWADPRRRHETTA